MDCGPQIIRAPSQPPMAPPNSPLPLYDVTRTSYAEPFQLPETAEYHSYISAAVYNIAMAGSVQQASALSRPGHAADIADMREYMNKTSRDIPASMKKVKYAKVYPANFDSGEKLHKTDTELQRIASLFCVEPDTRRKQDVDVSSTNNNAAQTSILAGGKPQRNATNNTDMRKYVDITWRDIAAVCDAQQTTTRPRSGHATDNADMREYIHGSKRAVSAGVRKVMHAKVYPASINTGKKLQNADTELKRIASLFCVDPDTRFQQNKDVSSINNNAVQANTREGVKPQIHEISRYTASKRRSFRKSRKVCPCNVLQDQSGPLSKERMEKVASMFCVETRDSADMNKKRLVYSGEAGGDNSKDVHNKSGRRNPVFAFFQGLKRLVTRR